MELRPIVVFVGEITPKHIEEVIGKDFSGDIYVCGDIVEYVANNACIKTNGGTLYVDGGIYLYGDLTVEGDVIVIDTIDSDGIVKINGSLTCYQPCISTSKLCVSEDLVLDLDLAHLLDDSHDGDITVGGDFVVRVKSESKVEVFGEKLIEYYS